MMGKGVFESKVLATVKLRRRTQFIAWQCTRRIASQKRHSLRKVKGRAKVRGDKHKYSGSGTGHAWGDT